MTSALYRSLLRPWLFRLDPETAHHLTIGLLEKASSNGLLRGVIRQKTSGDGVTLFGLKFPNRVGLAAGLDKNAVALLAWEALGFGFIEAGTITAKAQPGNPKPRVFRYPALEALINRFGFNNEGAEAVAARLTKQKLGGKWPSIPVGINLGKSKVTPIEEAAADYLTSFRLFFELGDYFVLNVSSPNTPGLRTLQGKEELEELLATIQGDNNTRPASKPLLLKIAPDLTNDQILEILGLVQQYHLAGIIATNTTLDHSVIPAGKDQQGGLSGKPLRARSTEVIRFISANTTLPIIGVGGIHDAASAQEKLDAGASLVQIYTGLIYEGPGLVSAICSNLRK